MAPDRRRRLSSSAVSLKSTLFFGTIYTPGMPKNTEKRGKPASEVGAEPRLLSPRTPQYGLSSLLHSASLPILIK